MSQQVRVLVPLAHGSEEIEAVCLIDTLVRANCEVISASVEDELTLICSRGVKITADCYFKDIYEESFDLIVLPGGVKGAETFSQTELLINKITKQYQQNKYLAAMCASPALVLTLHHIATERLMTAHPAFQDKIIRLADPALRVVVDKNLITSQAPGTAIEFALTLTELICSREIAQTVADPMLVKR